MHNIYISSTISVRCKGSLSFSINDYTCFLDDRFDRNNQISKSLSPCCACCANNNSNSLYRVVPINPRVFYGSRQSTLIQWPTSRRLILGGANQCYSRFTVCDVDRISYGKSYTFKERGFIGRRRKLGKGRYGCNVDDVDAEVLLSLLTEEVGEECLGVRDRNGGKSSRRVQLVKRVKTSDNGNSSYKSMEKDVGSRSLEGTSKTMYESSKFRPRKEEKRQEVDIRAVKRENFSGGENRRERREGSSGSSYYSFSSSGEFESDSEVQAKLDGFAGESSSGYVGDHGEIRYGGQVSEEADRHGSYAEEQRSFLRKENFGKGLYAASSGVEFDWRKKSEKKLNEELSEQSESGKESSEKKSRLSDVRETGYRKSSNFHEYYDDINEKSRLSVNIDELTRQQHSQTGQRVSEQSESRIKYKQFTEIPEIHDSGFETTSSSQNQYRGREKNLVGSSGFVQETAGDQLKSDVLITREEKHRRNSQQLGKVSEIREIGKIDTSISHRRSETRMKNQEDDATITPPLVDDTVEQHDQAGHGVTCQSGSGGEYQHMTGISNTQNINIQNRSNNRISIQEENSDSAVISYPEAPKQVSQMDSDSIRRQESRTESQDFSNYNDAEKASSSNMVSGRRTRSQETYLSSAVKLVEETKERHNLTDERLLRIGQIKEAQRPTKAMSFREGVLEAAPGSQASSELDSQNNLVQSIVDEDALGSVARLQQASTHFVGEFVEKVRHEVSTSEVQEERKTHETKYLHESEPHEHKGLTQHSSGESQQMDHDSRRSSQGSGTKGPSDEMWHVTDPSSSQEPKKIEEVPEATATTTTPENSVVKRTGRSLWSVISDIVQLRWAPRSDTNNSRSGGKSSPNQSTSSEAFFSGHDPDENDDENVKQRSRSILPESSIVDQKQPVGIQGELSGSKRSKDTIKLAKLSPPYSSNFLTGSVSKDIVSPTFEGTGTKLSVGTSSSSLISEQSFPLPAIRMRRSPVIREISEAGKTDLSGSDTMVPIEQQVSTSLAEVSGTEGKDGEKKQRKLQRSKQVPKDTFDEWEEAYILEAEQRKNDEMFMREALLEARKAADVWEMPVGAVLVQHGKIIARGCNLVEESRDSTAHAEMICIREASNILHSWRLAGTTLYVTLEPCPMCAGAILQARIDTIVWGAPNKLLGADGSWIRLFPGGGEGQNGSELGDKPAAPVHPFHPNIKIRRGVLASECADAMQQFFQLRRKKKEKKSEPLTPPSCLPISTRHHPSKFFTKMHNALSIMFCL